MSSLRRTPICYHGVVSEFGRPLAFAIAVASAVSCGTRAGLPGDEPSSVAACAAPFIVEHNRADGGAHWITAAHGDLYFTRVRGVSVQLVRVPVRGGAEAVVYADPTGSSLGALGVIDDNVVIVKQWPPTLITLGGTERPELQSQLGSPGRASFVSASVGPSAVYWTISDLEKMQSVVGATDARGRTTILIRGAPGWSPQVFGVADGAVLATDAGELSFLAHGSVEPRSVARLESPVLDLVADGRTLFVSTARGIASVTLDGDVTWLSDEYANHLYLAGANLFASRRGNSSGSDPATATQQGRVARLSRDGRCRTPLLSRVKAGSMVHANGDLFVFVLPFFDYQQGDLWRVSPSDCGLACR